MPDNNLTNKQAEAIKRFLEYSDSTCDDRIEQLDFIFLNALNDEDNPPSAADFLLLIELKKLFRGLEPISQP